MARGRSNKISPAFFVGSTEHVLSETTSLFYSHKKDLGEGRGNVCLQFVIVVFPDHTHLLFLTIPKPPFYIYFREAQTTFSFMNK